MARWQTLFPSLCLASHSIFLTDRRASLSASLALVIHLLNMIGTNGNSENTGAVVNISADEQNAMIETEYIKCLEQMIRDPFPVTNTTYCPRMWDDLLCWPDTAPGTVAIQTCPDYVQGFQPWENATRRCMEDGTWYFDLVHNRTWTDLRYCTSEVFDDPIETSPDFFKSHMGRIRLMYNTGYGVSLVSLVVSAIIMIGFRKLHCPRNTIHLNLFISFIFRASFHFMKENLLVEGLGFPSDVIKSDGRVIFKNGSLHWECKLFFTCFSYILGANYMWIFAEALYLHMLISVTVFSDRSSIKWYIFFGWLSPIVFVVPWVVVRALLEDLYCWNTHPTAGYFWIMRGPIVLSIVLNFAFFLNIIRVLFTKLNAINSPEAKKFRYRKLAKSTLVLIPLFGVHYIVFAGLPTNVNRIAELVQLYFEMFFNSVQGFFVALLFCFLNGEVQSEIKKKWHRFRIHRLHHLPKGRNNSHNVTYATYLSRARESIASVTQFQETRDYSGNGSARLTSVSTQDSSTALLPLKTSVNANGSTTISEVDEYEPMIHQTSFTLPDNSKYPKSAV